MVGARHHGFPAGPYNCVDHLKYEGREIVAKRNKFGIDLRVLIELDIELKIAK